MLVEKGVIRPRHLMFMAISFAGCSFLFYSRLNLEPDYGHYAFARALQGFGYAFFFVPPTVLTYSELRPDQNDKASSLTNFLRNWGGSFGIALATTLAERRSSFHQARLVDNLPASSRRLQQMTGDIGRCPSNKDGRQRTPQEERSLSSADSPMHRYASWPIWTAFGF